MNVSDKKILEYADDLCRLLVEVIPAKKSEMCRHKSRSPGRYCTATTHDNCDRCRFFEPTVMARIRSLVDRLDATESSLKTSMARVEVLNKDVRHLKDTIEYQNGEIDYLENRVKELQKMARRKKTSQNASDCPETDDNAEEDK